MIKVISVFSILVFLSSAVKSFAEDTSINISGYDNVWTFSDSQGYLTYDLEADIHCTLDQGSQSKLRVTNFSGNLGVGFTFDTPVKPRSNKNSSTILTLPEGTIVSALREPGEYFTKIDLITHSGDNQELSSSSKFVENSNLSSIYNQNLTAGFFGPQGESKITLRLLSEDEMGVCNIDDNNHEPFISRFIIFESLDKRNLFLIKESDLSLFQFDRAEYSERPSVRTLTPISPEASDIDKANYDLLLSGPDTQAVLAWIQRRHDEQPQETSIPGANIFVGSSRTIVCTIDREGIEVLDDEQNLLEGFNKAPNGTIALISQDYEPLIIDDIEYRNVIFRDNGRQSGWVPAHAIKTRAECSSLNYPMAQVVNFCTASSGLTRVRDESLENIVDEIPDNTRALVISEEPRKHTISGTEYLFVELSIEGKEGTFWAPNKFLSTSTCEVYRDELRRKLVANQYFPILQTPERSYIQNSSYTNSQGYNGRRWITRNGVRVGTRSHAASDLWTKFHRTASDNRRGGQYRSIAAGTVIRDVDEFYLETWEVAVLDDRTGRIYRYGEVYPWYGDPANGRADDDIPIERGNRWSPGQIIGHVKWVGENSVKPMLHFEMYSAGSSNLTEANSSGLDVSSSKSGQYGLFRRHSKLVNPENFLRELENAANDL